MNGCLFEFVCYSLLLSVYNTNVDDTKELFSSFKLRDLRRRGKRRWH